MSTLPHDASSSTDTAPLVTTQQTEHDLDAVLREFDVIADEVAMSRPSAAQLRELCRQVADISRNVFPGDVRFKVGRDWEVPDWIYFVVDVCPPQDADESVARMREWDLAINRTVGGHAALFCLSFGLTLRITVPED